jgi:hypothetical protein
MPSITTKESREPARMAGAISGKVTVKSVVKAEAPDTSEASSRLGSMLRSAEAVNM